MKSYDLVVIGAGSGGLVAATSGHRRGLKTALIEKNKIGGECTHSGCVPSKALLYAAKSFHGLKKMGELGIEVSDTRADFAKIMEGVDRIIQGIYQHETPDIFEDMGIDVYVNSSGAKFIDEHSIQIGDETLESKNFIICTGSSPRSLKLEGIDQVDILDNENFWELREHPGKIVFIGGGVISVELGQALTRLGCDVCIMDINDRVLKVTDQEIGKYICDVLEKEGIDLISNATPLRFTDGKNLVYRNNDNEHTLNADSFFLAVGRSPNVDGLQLENAGVEYSPKGIKSNSFLQTSSKHIYACGDVTTPFKFTHTASHQANICIENIINGNTKENDLSILPWAIFCDPEIGHVGLTLQQAHDKYGKDKVSVFNVKASIDRFITDRSTGGMLKVIFNNDDLVVGAEAVGAHAGEWIQLLTLVIKNKIPADQMADTIFAYPSYSEIVKKAFTRYLRTK